MSGTNESYFHESWLGMVRQDGLVVSVPVLTSAGLMFQRGAAGQRAYREHLHPPVDAGGRTASPIPPPSSPSPTPTPAPTPSSRPPP